MVSSNVQGSWRFTGFYGQLDISKWEETWQVLEAFGSHNNSPWLCIGNYNEILSNSEKLGGQSCWKDRWTGFKILWIYASSRIWGYSVANSLGQDILRLGIVYGLDWIVL